ncbi:MAG: Acetyltransferase (GNAT) family protein [Methanomassiliicoccales archaeon PtaU1.Bin124]|nr:MAG: Acetyltransferase (GNAT) family protein [Methanomassiliicoccales archaeon PtaU1.Bin124]
MELRVEHFEKGNICPPDLDEVLDDAGKAVRQIPDVHDRILKLDRLEQIRSGKFDLAIIKDMDRPVGFLAYQTIDDDASLRFGHVLPQYERYFQAVLASSIGSLKALGLRSVMGLFNWPQRRSFVDEAMALGFIQIDRMNMVRRPGVSFVHKGVPEGITIMPWSNCMAQAAAHMLFKNSSSKDRSFHRPYRTLQGCQAYLAAIIGGRYGEFLPDHSFLALRDGREVGVVLVAKIPKVGINMVDLAVDSAERGRGIATVLIDRMIVANSKGSNVDIVLAVTSTNLAAKHLYEKMGFEPIENIQYYYLEL